MSKILCEDVMSDHTCIIAQSMISETSFMTQQTLVSFLYFFYRKKYLNDI